MTTSTGSSAKSILFTSRCPSRYEDDSDVSSSSDGISRGTRTTSRPTLANGKLLNLRNYYARRRPTLKPPLPSYQTPILIVSSEQEDGDDEESLSSSSSSSSLSCASSAPVSSKGVRFRSHVTIHEIPSRKEYSKADKRAIWTPRRELKKLILKNHTEFTFEGRDWRNAPEEEEFGRDEDGELVHPVHLAMKRRKRSPQQVLLNAAAKKRSSCSDNTDTDSANKRRCVREPPLSGNSNGPTMIEAEEDCIRDDETEHPQLESRLEQMEPVHL
ncbi:hypothetical protein ACA910_001249 [Epithemia clementina (nom. ined.)]